jgi:hypothetical protein
MATVRPTACNKSPWRVSWEHSAGTRNEEQFLLITFCGLSDFPEVSVSSYPALIPALSLLHLLLSRDRQGKKETDAYTKVKVTHFQHSHFEIQIDGI